jgi:hypothetical protein
MVRLLSGASSRRAPSLPDAAAQSIDEAVAALDESMLPPVHEC